jgi:hypothetical protein
LTVSQDQRQVYPCKVCLAEQVRSVQAMYAGDFSLGCLFAERSLILRTKRQIGVLAAQDEVVEAIRSLSRPVSTQ